MADALTCTDAQRGTETLVKELFVKMDDGSYAVKVTTVTGGDAVDCDLTEVPTLNMLQGAMVRIDDVLVLQIQEVS
ncbi:MAG TPA: hypothetical protein PKJ19_15170 [Flavobacteriales bacterium]|nr:hypothetical protein [Flavobacteriales bacterium]HNU57466.1 hypothetical protein [Flavobacteriales bacterium]